MESVSELMEACEALARGAGATLRERWSKPRTVEHKGLIDLVTDADKASEEYLVTQVRQRFPAHSILAEESGAHEQQGASVVWVMDPLDGTTNYAHGFPHFNVSVAACTAARGPALAGCVMDPLRNEAFVVGKGLGAWLVTTQPNGQTTRTRLQVTPCDDLGKSLLATGFPYDRHRHADNNHPEHDALSLRSQGVRRPGAAALDLAYVAAGRLDGYWEAHLSPWDVAAGALLVLEAGGVVTGYDGVPFDGSQSAIISAGPRLHAALREAVLNTRRQRGFPDVPVARK
ncbi:MAG: inositol monophosphatase family protein [Myxococcota bacterium]